MSNIKGLIITQHNRFLKLLGAVEVTDKRGASLSFADGVSKVVMFGKRKAAKGGKVFFIGNGGSAAIASHMAIDFWKNGKIPSLAFNDSSLLTCISNDFGYNQVFAKPIEFFANKNDILFAISSSGKSENILKAVDVALTKRCQVITLSGFHKNNPLRSKGTYNFYVSSHEYGHVEVIHQYICHLILNTIIHEKS